MVLLGRIELPTSALPRMRSTTELQQHTIPSARAMGGGQARALATGAGKVKPVLEIARRSRQGSAMAEHSAPTREQRLAAKLRENLRRRKAQGRALDDSPDDAAALPKPPANR